jgi:hypothetical protein
MAGKLNSKVHEEIVKSVRSGSFVSVAASSAGIAPSTFRNWMERGEMEEARIAEGFPPAPEEAKYVAFRKDVEIARAAAEVDAVQMVKMAAKNGTWQAAAWYLERSFPQRWSRNRIEEIVEEKEDADPQLALSKLIARLEAMDSSNEQ